MMSARFRVASGIIRFINTQPPGDKVDIRLIVQLLGIEPFCRFEVSLLQDKPDLTGRGLQRGQFQLHLFQHTEEAFSVFGGKHRRVIKSLLGGSVNYVDNVHTKRSFLHHLFDIYKYYFLLREELYRIYCKLPLS
jgi:hypothetical protein